MQKIAMPVLDHKLSPHFAHSLLFEIFHVENKTIIDESLVHVPSQLSEPLPVWLINKGITDVITRGIGHKEINLFNQHKINVFVGVKIGDPTALVQEYLDGMLETNGNLCDN